MPAQIDQRSQPTDSAGPEQDILAGFGIRVRGQILAATKPGRNAAAQQAMLLFIADCGSRIADSIATNVNPQSAIHIPQWSLPHAVDKTTRAAGTYHPAERKLAHRDSFAFAAQLLRILIAPFQFTYLLFNVLAMSDSGPPPERRQPLSAKSQGLRPSFPAKRNVVRGHATD